MIKKEISGFKSQKEDIELTFRSGGIISNLANNRNSLGLRRHKLMVNFAPHKRNPMSGFGKPVNAGCVA